MYFSEVPARKAAKTALMAEMTVKELLEDQKPSPKPTKETAPEVTATVTATFLGVT
jgi:hypothetical protein